MTHTYFTVIYLVIAFGVFTSADEITSPITGPDVRYYPASFFHDNSLFVFGGGSTAGRTNTFIVYNFTRGGFVPPPTISGTLPIARLGHSLVRWRDSMILFGGQSAAGRLSEIHSFNLTTYTWNPILPVASSNSSIITVPTGRSLQRATVYGDKLLIFGGSAGSTVLFGDLWEFDLIDLTWTQIEQNGDLPGNLTASTAVMAKNNSVWVFFGGNNNNAHTSNVWELTLSTYTWRLVNTKGSAPTARVDHVAIVREDDIMVVALGYYMNTFLREFLYYDIKNDTWLTVPGTVDTSLVLNRDSATAVYSKEQRRMIIYGGGQGTSAYSNQMNLLEFSGAPPLVVSGLTSSSTSMSNTVTSGGVVETTDDNVAVPGTDNNSTNGSKNNTGIIAGVVGGVGGAIIALILIVTLVVVIRRKRQGKNDIMMRNESSSVELGRSSSSRTSPSGSHGQTSLVRNDSNYAPIMGKSVIQGTNKKLGAQWEVLWDEITIEGELGRGAFGVVYLGEWRNQKAAVKRLIGDFSPKEVDDFLAEAELMSLLRPHENVLQFLGVCANPIAIITKFYEGGSLASYIKKHFPLPMVEVVQILKGAAAGVAHLHREKIVHRDLACRNILIDKRDNKIHAVVSDFGFARTVQSTDTGTTKANIGPIRWMSPESLHTKTYSLKSDIWSFGVVVWEMVTGEKPWGNLEDVKVILSTLAGNTLPIPSGTPNALRDLMADCWRANPEERPTIQEIYNRLELLAKEL